MGWKFKASRRSIKILPGVRINTGKKGITSVTLGGSRKGPIRSSVNIGHQGVRTTHSIKGVGSVSNYRKHKETSQGHRSTSSKNNRIDQTQQYSSKQNNLSSRKSKEIALILCLLFGWWGIHSFYLGHVSKGLLQLFTFGGFGVWVIVDFVWILLDRVDDSNGNPLV